MNAYHQLQIARDARLEGRDAEYAAVLDEIGVDIAHKRRSDVPRVNLRALVDAIRESLEDPEADVYGRYEVTHLRRAIGFAGLAEWQREPTWRRVETDDGGIEMRLRMWAHFTAMEPSFSGVFAVE